MAEQQWKLFENRVKSECLANRVMVVRIPDEMRWDRGSNRPYRKKTAFDFACAIDGKACFLDAKTCEAIQWNIKSYVLAKEKIHQWHHLCLADEMGSIAGYIVWFTSVQKIAWVSVKVVKDAIKRGESSITPVTEGVICQPDDQPINMRWLAMRQL